MLKVIKAESHYYWGSDGFYWAVTVFDTKTKKVLTLLQWGGYIRKGNYYPSDYSMKFFNNFSEAVKEMRNICERSYPNA